MNQQVSWGIGGIRGEIGNAHGFGRYVRVNDDRTKGPWTMRVTTAFKHLLGLDGIEVTDVAISPGEVRVAVRLRRRRLVCPHCSYSSRWRYDTREAFSRWRHLDLGTHRLLVEARLRRVHCPDHGVVTESVPFARAGAGFTRDFEHLVAWCAAKMDKTAVDRLLRINWRTVGAICSRVVQEAIDPKRLEDLFEIGIDEVSWRRHHRYLTLVTDHASGKVIWGTQGKGKVPTEAFFDELGPQRAASIQAVSMDLAPGYAAAVASRSTAEICYDPFHVVALATTALQQVRRESWQRLRRIDPHMARVFKGWRYALLKNPENLSDAQRHVLDAIRTDGGELWRAYELKESLRAIFHGDLSPIEAEGLLATWCVQAHDSGLRPFARLAATVHVHADGILAGIRRGLTNARAEAINTKVRLITRRAYGFHSAAAAIALIMLACGPVNLQLPHERSDG